MAADGAAVDASPCCSNALLLAISGQLAWTISQPHCLRFVIMVSVGGQGRARTELCEKRERGVGACAQYSTGVCHKLNA